MPLAHEPNSNVRTFDIDVCLGRGGFGEVYRARMTQPGGLTTTVALKVLLSGVDPASQPVERLRDEGRLLAALEHPVIMRAIDITVIDGRVALVAEYIDGQDLNECCRGTEPVTQRGLAHVIGEIASALHKAWSTPSESGKPLNLVHRDIKPSNIRVGRHGEVKLLDFGIARSDTVMREAKTATQMVVGSLQYMAPERFDDRPMGPEADVFALGCCLFEGLSGQMLNAGVDPPRALRLALDAGQFAKHLQRRKRALREGTDPRIIALMEHCLAHDPDDRPSSAELVERCDLLAGELPGGSLRAWARKRDWPDVNEAAGPMTGKSFTETLAMQLPHAKPIPPPPNSRRVELPPETVGMVTPPAPFEVPDPEAALETAPSSGRRVLMGGVILLIAAALATVGGAGLMGGAMWFNDEPVVEDDVHAEPVDEVDPAPAPVEDAPGEAEPPDETPPMPRDDGPGIRPPQPVAPVITEPPGTDEPVPEPTPEQPVETPEPEPTPPPVQPQPSGFGTVRVNGEQRVILRAGGVDHKLGRVPVGRYVVYVDFGEGEKRSLTVRIAAGEVLRLKCNTLLSDCIYD